MLKHRFPGLSPSEFDSADLESGLRICIFNKFPEMLMLLVCCLTFGEHCCVSNFPKERDVKGTFKVPEKDGD